MHQTTNLRYLIIGTLFACSILPVFLLTAYTAALLPVEVRWPILGIGLVSSALGTLVVMMLLVRWEREILEEKPVQKERTIAPEEGDNVTHLRETLDIQQELQESLSNELQQQKMAYQKLIQDKEELQHQVERLEQSLTAQQERTDDQVRGREAQLQECLQTIADQQALLEKRNRQISTLENTARDLKYELKTLLDLTDSIQQVHEEEQEREEVSEATRPRILPPKAPTPMAQPLEPAAQLKRCIDIAQKLTGARHLASHTPRFQDQSVDGYALDFRRLCDSLRSESSNLVFLYSPKEHRPLFVNNQIQALTGWTPEKFIQDFNQLLLKGREEFHQSVRQLTPIAPSIQIPMALKTKAGETRYLNCYLGLIPTGIFKTNVIGVLQA